jgi:hypothetical protein
MQLEDALTIIKKAKICGGTSNKISNNQIEFEQWEKDFSENFQRKCKKCGILSFYEDKNLGLRSTHIPLEVVQRLEEITQNPTIDREQLSKNAMFGVNYIQGSCERLKLQIKKNAEAANVREISPNENTNNQHENSFVGSLQKSFGSMFCR